MITYDKLIGFFDTAGLDTAKLHPFLSMVEPRKKMHRETIRKILDDGVKPFNAYIPYSADVEKMGFYRAPLNHYRPASIGAKAFAKLWSELSTRMSKADTHEH
jgi:cellulose biosynthesis protein BcsQ